MTRTWKRKGRTQRLGKKGTSQRSNLNARSKKDKCSVSAWHAVASFLRRNWKFMVTSVLGLLGLGAITVKCSSDNQANKGDGNVNVRGDGNVVMPSIVFKGDLVINHITLSCDDKSFEMYTMDEALKGIGVTPEKIGLPKILNHVLLKDPPGLGRVADAVEQHYEAGRLHEAYALAQIGRDIINPKITPYLNRTCSIEATFAAHITAVYLILADEAWSHDDFQTARRYAHLVVGLWGKRVSGEVYAFAAAIEIDEKGGSDSILCEEAVRRFNSGDLKWVHQYLNRLARWGYVHPVAVDEKDVAYHFDYAEAFCLPEKLMYKGPYMRAQFPTKDGRMLENGELIVTVYRGFGRIEAGYIPDPKERQLPVGFTGSLSMPTARKVGNQPRPGPKELTESHANATGGD